MGSRRTAPARSRTPHVIPVLGTEPDARPIVEPQTAPFGLLLRHLKVFPLPDPLHTLVVHMPPHCQVVECNMPSSDEQPPHQIGEVHRRKARSAR